MRRLPAAVSTTLGTLAAVLAAALVAGCGTGPDDSYGGTSDVQVPVSTVRVESFAGVQLEVPRDWALGTLGCAEPDRPYVARPDPVASCRSARVARPTREAVWFDSPLPVGARTVDGLHLRTLVRAGVRITVAGRTADRVDRVLATAHGAAVDAHGCRARPEAAGGYPDEGIAGVVRFAVCLYPRPDAPLLWSTELPAAAGRQFVAAERAARPVRPEPEAGRGPVVVLVLTADEGFGTLPATVSYRVRLDPPRQVTGGRGNRVVALTAALLEPWDVPGLRLYAGARLPR
jgi:hypothetical protein